MIEINGSYGEGGGQILRSALSLSILTKKPVHIVNIRANRPKPGIKPQHYTVINILKTLSSASVEGLKENATEITFYPDSVTGGTYRFDVGTAGSIVLIAQAVLFATLKMKHRISLELTGGTDVKWAPSWDYFLHVFLPILKRIGVDPSVVLRRRGYYPRGGGNAIITMDPRNTLNPLELGQSEEIDRIYGQIHFHNLPSHVMKRLKHTVLKTCVKQEVTVDISTEQSETFSPGVILTLWTKHPQRFFGCVGLGERGVSAESIGYSCTTQLVEMMRTKATMDSFVFDQILGFLMSARGTSTVRIPHLSNHAKTNMWLIEQFFPGKKMFTVSSHEHTVKVTIQGQDILSYKE